ncbi:MAG: ATP-binding protein [Lacunisphaera sp.]
MNDCLINLNSLTLGLSGVVMSQGKLAYVDWALLVALSVIALLLFSLYLQRNKRGAPRGLTEPETLVANATTDKPDKESVSSEFMAAVAHEIRNPMNGIVGLIESLKLDGLDAESRRKVNLLRQCAGHLASLLEDLLGSSEDQTDGFKLAPETFEVSALVESIVALTAMESEKRGIPLEIALSPAVPRQLIGDPRRVRQILLNFIYNALKYSRGGVVSVTVWRNQNLPGSAEMIFAVSDDGPGIPEREQKDLFTQFDRGSQPPSDGAQGPRLGLFICKTLAEKMNGRVWFKSEAGKGSCFYFSATFHAPHEESQTPRTSLIPFPHSLRHALLIDDAEYNRIALSGMLETLGLTVRATADAQEFLSVAQSQDFDVIFIDYSVGDLDGPALAKQIRAMSGASAKATIFATTGFNSAEKRAACLTAGMDAFLTKPITIERLRRALKASVTSESAPESPPIHRDPLANLRLLAGKKGVPFIDELNLYFLEFEAEFEKLADALKTEDSGRAGYFAHLLYGRCSFINERELELTLRKIEANAAMERWDEASKLGQGVRLQADALRIKLVAGNPVAPRA